VFVGAILEPDLHELLVWTSWFSILGFLKIFSLLCRDRFEWVRCTNITNTNTNTNNNNSLYYRTFLTLVLLFLLFLFLFLLLVVVVQLVTSTSSSIGAYRRVLALLLIVLFSDICWFMFCIFVFENAGASVLLLLTFECFTLFLDTMQTLIKYGIHFVEMRGDGVWEQRVTYVYYTEVCVT
jgi:E3 ubiquitin-protein ligase AMFR